MMFRELQLLSTISEEAFSLFYEVQSHEAIGNDILVVCPTSEQAGRMFKEYAKDRFSNKMSVSGRWIEIEPNKGKIYFKSLNSLQTWLSGRRFKKIYFRED